jgi:hypothetical protein
MIFHQRLTIDIAISGYYTKLIYKLVQHILVFPKNGIS